MIGPKELGKCQFHQHFRSSFFVQKFFSKLLCVFGFVNFWQKEIGTNAACKMLTKLTTICRSLMDRLISYVRRKEAAGLFIHSDNVVVVKTIVMHEFLCCRTKNESTILFCFVCAVLIV